jgi:hypothetical protein
MDDVQHAADRAKWGEALRSVGDDELMALVGAVSDRLIVPNWFDRETLEKVLDRAVSQEEYMELHDFVYKSNCANRISEEIEYLWNAMAKEGGVDPYENDEDH